MRNIAAWLLFFIALIGGYTGLLILVWWLKWLTIPILLLLIVGLHSFVGKEQGGHNV